MEQYSGPTTTATSQTDGRLKVAAGCSHKKSKCLKCAISKKDGAGGPGLKIDPVGYGATSAQKNIIPKLAISPMTSKPHRSKSVTAGLKLKKAKSISSSIKSLGKKMKFAKALKSSGKMASLKGLLKGL